MPLSLASNITDFTKQAKGRWGVSWKQASLTLADRLAPVTFTLPSEFGSETLITMGALPPAVEYAEGELPGGGVAATSPYVLTNKLFGNTVRIGRSDWSDMQNNPSLAAMWLEKIAALALTMKNVKAKALKDLIRGVGLYDSSVASKDVNAFDGANFFAGSGTRSMGMNLIDGTTTWDVKTLQEEYDTIISKFLLHKALGIESVESGSQSTYIRSSAPDKFLILCPPSKQRVMAQAWVSMLSGGLFSAASANAAGVSTIPNVIAQQVGVTIIPVQELETDLDYYVFDISDSVPGEKAIVFVDREEPGIEYLGQGSDTYTLSEVHIWKTRGRFTWGWGNPAMAIKVEKDS